MSTHVLGANEAERRDTTHECLYTTYNTCMCSELVCVCTTHKSDFTCAMCACSSVCVHRGYADVGSVLFMYAFYMSINAHSRRICLTFLPPGLFQIMKDCAICARARCSLCLCCKLQHTCFLCGRYSHAHTRRCD